MPHIEAARSRGAKSLSSRWRMREYELGCGHSGNEPPKKNPETQQNLWKKNSTYIPKSLPLAIHKISILNEPVVVHGKSTQTSKKLSLYPQGSLWHQFLFFSPMAVKWVYINVVWVYHLFGYIWWVWVGYIIYFTTFSQNQCTLIKYIFKGI